jgi:hypothetical protein
MRRCHMNWYLQLSDQGSLVSCIVKVAVNLRNILYNQTITCEKILSYVIKSIATKHVAACSCDYLNLCRKVPVFPIYSELQAERKVANFFPYAQPPESATAIFSSWLRDTSVATNFQLVNSSSAAIFLSISSSHRNCQGFDRYK